MDTAPFLYASLTILFLFLIRKLSTAKTYHLPPTPAAALPVIGHLHLLKQPLHRTLHRLAQATGPIFSLKLGFRRCVVVSSPCLAEECFTKLDTALANRPRILVDDYIGYKQRSMVGAPYGAYWRSLRRIAAQELLSSARLSGFLPIRRDEANRLLLSLLEASRSFRQVELRPKLSELTFNIMMRMIAGKRYSGKDGEEGRRFTKLISDVLAAAQASNPQDFLPFLQWIDYGGYTKKLASLGKELDDFFESLIDEHRRQRKNSMIGHLLSLRESQPEFCSDHIIKGFIMTWVPNFNPYKDSSTKAQVWIRVFNLPHEYWHPEVLSGIARHVGAPIVIDGLFAHASVGHFARILVEMDVSKAVPDFFDVKCGDRVFVLEFRYEDLPYYCHSCCVVGHATTSCRRSTEGMNDTEGQPAGKGTDPAPVQQQRSKWKQVDRKQACSEASLQMVVYEKGGILSPSNRDSALGDDEMDTYPDSTREEVVGSLNLGSHAAQVDLHNTFAALETLDAEVQLDNEVVSENSVGDNRADKSVGMEIVPVMNDTTRHPVETTIMSDTQVDIVTLHCSNTDMALTVTPGKATMEDPPIIRGRGRPKGASKKGKVSDSSIKNRLRRIIKNGMSSDKQATGRVAGAVLQGAVLDSSSPMEFMKKVQHAHSEGVLMQNFVIQSSSSDASRAMSTVVSKR